MHKARRTALFVNVMAALRGEVLTVTHLGRAIRSEAKEKGEGPGSINGSDA